MSKESITYQCVDCDHTQTGNQHTWNGYAVCVECGGLMNELQESTLTDFNGRTQIIKKG